METDDATERNSAPITPNWKPVISPMMIFSDIFSIKKEEKKQINRIYFVQAMPNATSK